MTGQTFHIDKKTYQQLYQQSIEHPESFWANQAKQHLTWHRPWDTVLQGDFNHYNVRWFTGGKLNASVNCVDRHLAQRAQKTAIIWEGNNPSESQHITYAELHQKISTFANVLKSLGIKKGSRVCIYLPMVPEAIYAMLACARIGAIHSVVFAGFSSDALKARILDAQCELLITADEGVRGDKRTPLKQQADQAIEHISTIQAVIVVKRTGNPISWNKTRDIWFHEAMENASTTCEPEIMDATDPLFILYTSGSTGTPKGVVHSTGGYLLYTAMTHRYVFDYHDGDIYWCSADVGWITGHSYLVYGPLANGATTLLYEGIPNFPTHARCWEIIDKHQVNIFYTAPTAIRASRREGDHWVNQTHRSSLRLLGSVGEPINPDVWQWYYDVVGQKRCPIVNTWWQTETGGILLTPLPGATPLVAGTAGWPFFGIQPLIVNDKGEPTAKHDAGQLTIQQPWPGLMQTIYGNHQRYIDSYFKPVSGCYLTGDGAHYDHAGNLWITGRNDDVIKVSGHRLGTEELESAFLSYPDVAEAAVVGIPDSLKGEAIVAFVTLKTTVHPSNALVETMRQHIRKKIGPIATPKEIHWVQELPKTRSGKIMRRLLRKIASQQIDELGDISTLANIHSVEEIIKETTCSKTSL